VSEAFDAALDEVAFDVWANPDLGPGTDDVDATELAMLGRLDALEDAIAVERDPVRLAELARERDELDAEWHAREGTTLDELNDRDVAPRERDRPGSDEDPRLIERAARPEVRGRALLAADAAAARAFVRGREVALGFAAGELLARPPRGRPTGESRRRRDARASIAGELRGAGATVTAIAAAFGCSTSVAHDLLSRARVIRKAEVEGSDPPSGGLGAQP
jgi:hypothetical protein